MPELYHVLCRGVDKRKIFMDDKDRFRFIHDLYEFNDEAPAINFSYFCRRNPMALDFKTMISTSDVKSLKSIHRAPRKLLVNIHNFCLMPNHYHLFLSSLTEGGITLFMKKLNGGYVRYFNKKHDRKGRLFENAFKSIIINSQAHFIHLPYYIHLNPLDLIAPEWRGRKIENMKKAMNFLDSYRWSSHLDYMGENNFPSVTQRDFLLEVFEGESGYKKKLEDWLRELSVRKIGEYALE